MTPYDRDWLRILRRELADATNPKWVINYKTGDPDYWAIESVIQIEHLKAAIKKLEAELKGKDGE